MKVCLLNDCSDSRHFGCELVKKAYLHHFEKRGVELVRSYAKRETWDPYVLDSVDLVIVNAEGTVHHGKHARLLDVGVEYNSVFINSVFQENLYANWELNQFNFVSVRESMSRDDMIDNHKYEPVVVPDLIFTHADMFMNTRGDRRIGTFVSNSSTRITPGMPVTADCKDPEFVQKLSQSENAVCGRFHALCIAAMLDIPFSVYPGNTHKIEGIMRDMRASENYHATAEAAHANIPETVSSTVQAYVRDAPGRIDAMFDEILR